MQLNDIAFNIEKLHYYPTRNQVPVLLRPCVFNADSTAVQTLGDRLNESRSGQITPAMLSGVTSGIVQPSTVGYDSTLNADWVSVHRYLFMMKVSYIDHSGSELGAYLFGYTDYDGFSQQGSIDTNMMHYVNNIIETVAYHQQTPLGVRRMEKLNKIYNTIYSTSNTDIYTQRPMDMFEIMAAENMAQFMPMADGVEVSSNSVTPFTNNTVSSANDNNITTSYLANLLTGGIHAGKHKEIVVASMGTGGGYSTMADGQYGRVGGYGGFQDDSSTNFFTEPSITENLFIRALSLAAGSKVRQPYFKFGALMTMDRTIYDRANLFNLTNDFSSPILNRTPEVGDHWNGQDVVTLKAFSLMENSVSMATKYGFTNLSFIATNMSDALGNITITILGFNNFLTLTDDDHMYILKMFESRFKTDVFLSESNVGRTPIYMECHVNLMGTSKIYLEYSGFPGNWFTVPTFANSLYSPVVTPCSATMRHSAGEISRTMDLLTDAIQPNSHTYLPVTY